MKDFIKMSKYAGMREDLVQAGGGNSSYKLSEDRMVIKASGFQLSEINEDKGYAIVNPKIISEAFMNCPNLRTMTEEDAKQILSQAFIEGPRASIETFLHAMSGRYTLHTHSIVVNALAARKDGMDILKEMFPEAILVPYATPGVELAKVYFDAVKKNGKMSNVVFLQNHGVVVSAETGDEVVSLMEDIVKQIEERIGVGFAKYHAVMELTELFPENIIWTVNDINVLDAYRRMNGVWKTAFCPDCVVFLGKQMLSLQNDIVRETEEFKKIYGNPVVIEYCNNLYIIAQSVKKALEIQSVLSFNAQVALVNKEYEINYLSDQEQNFLLDWEVEKYRRNMK